MDGGGVCLGCKKPWRAGVDMDLVLMECGRHKDTVCHRECVRSFVRGRKGRCRDCRDSCDASGGGFPCPVPDCRLYVRKMRAYKPAAEAKAKAEAVAVVEAVARPPRPPRHRRDEEPQQARRRAPAPAPRPLPPLVGLPASKHTSSKQAKQASCLN